MDRITKAEYKFNLLNVLQGLIRYADVDEILNCLAAYEDTGLTPDGIVQNQSANRILIEVVNSYQAIGTVEQFAALMRADTSHNEPCEHEQCVESCSDCGFCNAFMPERGANI